MAAIRACRISNDELRKMLGCTGDEQVAEAEIYFDNIGKDWIINAVMSQEEAHNANS